MAKDTSVIQGSYKTWLCNAALFALICTAFAAGILLGPIVSTRGKDDLKEMCNSADDDGVHFAAERGSKSECISPEQLKVFMEQWRNSVDDLIEEKMLNVTKRKINPAIRKLSRAKDATTKKTIQGKVTFLRFFFLFHVLHAYMLTNFKPAKDSEHRGVRFTYSLLKCSTSLMLSSELLHPKCQ